MTYNHRQEHFRLRFNRYMVECEYTTKELDGKFFSVLIDTWWNVNEQI